MKQELEIAIQSAVAELFDVTEAIEMSRPEEKFGDFATNVALQLSKQLGRNPREIAEQLATKLRETLTGKVVEISVAGPGFINLKLTDEALVAAATHDISTLNSGRHVLLEYSCPNAFKELHTGHLYQTIVGDAIGLMLEATGAVVYRANFGGDVGLHVAKCLFGVVQILGGELPDELNKVDTAHRAEWLSKAYVAGAAAYESGGDTKDKIDAINRAVYTFHAEQIHDSPVARIYWECRQWSYDYFAEFYEQIQVRPFDKYYPESTTIHSGLKLVRDNIGKVFTESDNAVVYHGNEDAGLHTRVFITSQGLPTYEAKDLGVIYAEAADFEYDSRLIITGNDQATYMKVIFAALLDIDPDLAAKQTHRSNGTVKFADGQKMSSRLGNVTRAVDVIASVGEAVEQSNPGTDYAATSLAAIKYSFLKHRLGSDIAFDITESITLEGNSGPYLQYAHARACSILAKAPNKPTDLVGELEPGERALVRKISEFVEVVDKSITDFMPHYICTYLYELAQTFNSFYEHNRVIGDARQPTRLAIVKTYTATLRQGLNILGIPAPKKM